MWRRKFRKVWPLKECKLCATVHSSANLKLNISKSGQLWSSGEAVLPAGTNPSDWLIFSQCWDKRIDQDIFIVLYYRPSLGLLTQKETFFLNRFLFVYLYSFLCIQLILTKLYNCVTLGLSLFLPDDFIFLSLGLLSCRSTVTRAGRLLAGPQPEPQLLLAVRTPEQRVRLLALQQRGESDKRRGHNESQHQHQHLTSLRIVLGASLIPTDVDRP